MQPAPLTGPHQSPPEPYSEQSNQEQTLLQLAEPEPLDHVKLPAVRRLILPDPGHVLFDCDLSGADAQVVAWEANDEPLKTAFRTGLDIHNFNGTTIWGAQYSPNLVRRKLTWRDECKRSVHGTNYLSGVQNLSRTLGWNLTEVDQFQFRWFTAHPGIRDWHKRVDYDLQRSRRVVNRFGYRIIYFDRPANALPKAVAWGPQSTVAIVCSRGAVRVHRNIPWCNILLQVHDSVLFQLPHHRITISSLECIRRHLDVPVPYPDPLLIPWGLKMSKTNWHELGPKLDWSTLEPLKKAI